MKRFLKYIFIVVMFLVGFTANAVQITVPSAPGAGYWLTSTSTGAYIASSTNPIIVGYVYATTTTTASILPYASTTAISSTGSAYFATAGGNVGINTVSPLYPLHIASAGSLAQYMTAVTGTNALYTYLTNSGNASIFGIESSAGGAVFNGSLAYSTVFGTQSARAFHIATNNAIAVTVLSGGNVGIGTTSPFANLAINPVAGVASNQFAVGSSTAASFIINNSGNVGIGVISPTAKLQVLGTSAGARLVLLRLANNGAGVSTAASIGFSFSGGVDPSYISAPYVSSGTQLQFATGGGGSLANADGTVRMTIDAVGALGIATSTPVGRVDSYTTASTTNMLLESVAGTGGCLTLKDVQGGGYTQVYSQAGVLYSKVATSISSCN